ncbi:MAG: transporter [Verrucomicrobiae bacterium]|nr:transporter [Verrucomicrobiae bacterium]
MTIGISVWAGRPLVVDDAGTVAPFECELEAVFAYERDTGLRHVETPVALTYGLPARIDIGAAFGWQWEERRTGTGWESENDVTDLLLLVKWNPLTAERFWADHALVGTLKIPTADEDEGFGSGKVDYDLMYIATKAVTDELQADVNVGYGWIGGGDDVVHYGLALRWQATERIEWVAEVVTETVLASDNDTAVALTGGLRWSVSEELVLDAAVGGGLNKHAPDWAATVGLTWVFGFPAQSR